MRLSNSKREKRTSQSLLTDTAEKFGGAVMGSADSKAFKALAFLFVVFGPTVQAAIIGNPPVEESK